MTLFICLSLSCVVAYKLSLWAYCSSHFALFADVGGDFAVHPLAPLLYHHKQKKNPFLRVNCSLKYLRKNKNKLILPKNHIPLTTNCAILFTLCDIYQKWLLLFYYLLIVVHINLCCIYVFPLDWSCWTFFTTIQHQLFLLKPILELLFFNNSLSLCNDQWKCCVYTASHTHTHAARHKREIRARIIYTLSRYTTIKLLIK